MDGKGLIVIKKSMLFLLERSDLLNKELSGLLSIKLILYMCNSQISFSKIALCNSNYVLQLVSLSFNLNLIFLIFLLQDKVLLQHLIPPSLTQTFSHIILGEERLKRNEFLRLCLKQSLKVRLLRI